MKALDKKKYLLWARLKQHKNKVASAITKCKFYVALSGGKDSTVVAHLANLPLIHGNDELYVPETTAYIEEMKPLQLALRVEHADFFTSWDKTTPPKDSKIKFVDDFQNYVRGLGYDGVILGLRKEENARRRMLLGRLGPLFQRKDGLWYCNPIYNWKTEDVWAYIVENNVRYNLAYDRLREIGIDEKHCRIGPLFQKRVIAMGQIAILRIGWPQLFSELSEKYPEIRNYV